MASHWDRFRQVISRKRVFEPQHLETTGLKRCLTTVDLSCLGLGSTLGVGVYVLVGAVALRVAGPSVVVSFFIAAVASVFAGLCYAEFGARVPRAGSAYIYTYVTVGELAAFLIGWNMLLELVFGTASVARGLSSFIDSMTNGALSSWFRATMPINTPYFSQYFDLLAFLLVLVFGVLMALGVRKSSIVNNVLSIVNVGVILFIIIAGAFTAKSSNWSIPASEVPLNQGDGGFFPFGVWGTLQGAALCFYGFVGFDVINSAGEEVKEPRRSIPMAILIVLCVVFVIYASISIVLTMMVPYYELDKVAAAATAFTYVGWDWARWIVSVGACFGIASSLFGCMFPLPRLLYSMASDGLMLSCFGYVSSRKTPLVATLVPACIISILSAVMELEQLILMLCIGTLLSYTFVSISVVLFRYCNKNKSESSNCLQVLGCGGGPSQTTSRVVIVTLFIFVCTCVAAALVGNLVQRPLVPVAVLHGVMLVLLVVIGLQPQVNEEIPFKTPLVPLIPCLSIYVNINLMILVNLDTWIRVIIWMLIGIPIYAVFLYCYKRPSQQNSGDKLKHTDMNGKTPIQIVIEAPSPAATLSRNTALKAECDENVTDQINNDDTLSYVTKHPITIFKVDEITVEEASVENNEEKEAKIIDLLDQVLQAEEDSYTEAISFKEENVPEAEQIIMVPLETSAETGTIPHRKSLTELSDAGSEVSLPNQDTKYSVIAQVHKEDLPKLPEEEEKNGHERNENVDTDENKNETFDDTTNVNETKNEHVTDNEYDEDSETNSRTDESGYSDTLDRNNFNDSVEDNREETPQIPTPPPFDEKYFNSSPILMKKAFTIPARTSKFKTMDLEDENKPRESVQSNTSSQYDDDNIVFGSNKQKRFMNKLNNIYQNKLANVPPEEDKQRKRSNSTGDVEDTKEKPPPEFIRERPLLFLNLKKELLANSVPNLRPVDKEVESRQELNTNEDDVTEESSMSREDLKSKLEVILATGGPNLLKPRRMKSNPPTPEESYQTESIASTSSTESIAKLPKVEKNDTLKRQKDKFGAVLNSFMLSLNKEDAV